MVDDYSTPEIVRSLRRIETGLGEVNAELKAYSTVYVSRAEFQEWRTAIGREIGETKSMTRDGLAKLEQEIDARHAPWWSIVTAMAAVAAVLITVVPLIAR